jgi:predicted secreted Zn-dependent protease
LCADLVVSQINPLPHKPVKARTLDTIQQQYFYNVCENRTLKHVEIVLRRWKGDKKGEGKRVEFVWDTLYACMEISQQNPFV